MKEHTSIITRKGQITIPADIRRALSLHEGDKVAFEVEDDRIRITRRGSVVARTAGALKSDLPMLSPAEERQAAERAIADELIERLEA
jgi:AbrB family looped-hinge helix DNA binding protein